MFSVGGGEGEVPRSRESHRPEEPAGFGQQEGRICPTCRGVFDDFGTLQLHVLTCNGVSYKCPLCQEVFPDLDSLEIHVQNCGLE